MRGSDRQKRFVYGVARLFLLIFFKVEIVVFLVEFFKQILRVFAPRAEVVLVEHDNVPVCGVYKLVFRLYAARGGSAEQVLKGTEHNDRLCLVAFVKLLVKLFRVELRLFVAHELPAFKVYVVI